MKVQLVANLSTNGQLILAAQANAYQAPAEIAGMAFSKAFECGNIIIGRASYQMFSTIMKDTFATLDVVVLSNETVDADVYTAKSPEDAVHYLEEKGYEKACVAGGTMTYNAFLAAGLADDLFFNLFPVVINGGGTLETAPEKHLDYKLVNTGTCGDVVTLHFSK